MNENEEELKVLKEQSILAVKLIRELYLLKGIALRDDNYDFISFLVGITSSFYDSLIDEIKVKAIDRSKKMIKQNKL